jgi:hypothetical protein
MHADASLTHESRLSAVCPSRARHASTEQMNCLYRKTARASRPIANGGAKCLSAAEPAGTIQFQHARRGPWPRMRRSGVCALWSDGAASSVASHSGLPFSSRGRTFPAPRLVRSPTGRMSVFEPRIGDPKRMPCCLGFPIAEDARDFVELSGRLKTQNPPDHGSAAPEALPAPTLETTILRARSCSFIPTKPIKGFGGFASSVP